ncbi:hypothetical protein ACMFMG_010260 [Clarireedia jacksonii]
MGCMYIRSFPQTLKIPENASFESGRQDEVTDDYFPFPLSLWKWCKSLERRKAVRALLEDRPRTRSGLIGDDEIKQVPRYLYRGMMDLMDLMDLMGVSLVGKELTQQAAAKIGSNQNSP